VKHMWEGLDRFLKIIEVCGRVCVESKEYQHASEITLDKMKETCAEKLLKKEYENDRESFRSQLENEIKSRLDLFDKRLLKLQDSTEVKMEELQTKV